jgi:hypothetical protein
MDPNQKMTDGFSATIYFSSQPTIKLYEIDTTLPELAGGGANDTTTMRNDTLRTKHPKVLKSLGEGGATVALASSALPLLWGMINVNQLIRYDLPDNSAYYFWGWIDELSRITFKEGEMPRGNLKVIASNMDAEGDETAPVYSSTGATTTTTV